MTIKMEEEVIIGRKIFKILFAFKAMDGDDCYLATAKNRDGEWYHEVLEKDDEGNWFIRI